MARRSRPAAATFVAIINILLGLPCLCCSGCIIGGNTIDLAAGPQGDELDEEVDDDPQAKDPFLDAIKDGERQQVFLTKEVRHQRILQIALSVTALVSSLMLLVSGFLLLSGHSFGWLLAVLGLVLLLGASTIDAINDVVFVLPAMKKFDAQDDKPKQTDDVSAGTLTILQIAFTVVVRVGYPILALILLMTGPVRAYYANRPQNEHDRYQDDDDYDRRRRYDEDDYDRPRRLDDDDPRFR